jgi:hypothetical protein
MTKTSGDSTRRVSRIIFEGIQDSFTTQGREARKTRLTRGSGPHLRVNARPTG